MTSTAHPTVRPGSGQDDIEPVADPAKMLRLAGMLRGELAEIHALPLDDAARAHLVACHARALAEVDAALPAPLRHELDAVAPRFRVGAAVTDGELRVAHAQLAGWLEGLFQGVQFALAVRTSPAAGGPFPPGVAAPGRPPAR